MTEKTRDLVLRFLKLLNVVLVTVPFAACWYMYFAENIMAPFYRNGNYVFILLFPILYITFGRLYEAFKVSMKPVGELIYSQCLSELATNAIMFIMVWLQYRYFPPVLPLFMVLVVDILISFIWCPVCARIYYKLNAPKPTAIVYDTRKGLENLVSEYGLEKKYDVCLQLSADECLKNLEQLLTVKTVFISGVHSKQRNVILKYCIYNDIEVLSIPRVGDVIMSGAKAMHMFHLPMLQVRRYAASPEYLFIKRMLDIIISLIALILLSPIMLVVAIAIKTNDHGPAFYKQVRLTKDGKKFYIHKFRSMRVDAEKDGVARLSTGENDDRITPIGKFIRKCRFDELPQLLDILSGNLSIVGPRPERPEIAAQYCEEMPEFALRLQAKAGLTGYAQVYGQYNTTPYDKLLMDLMYIAHPSFVEDIKIMAATVKVLFMSDSTEGVEEGKTTAAK